MRGLRSAVCPTYPRERLCSPQYPVLPQLSLKPPMTIGSLRVSNPRCPPFSPYYSSQFPGSEEPPVGTTFPHSFVGVVDVLDAIIEVHAYAKQGTGYRYSEVRGLNALLATASTKGPTQVLRQRCVRGGAQHGRGPPRELARGCGSKRREGGGEVPYSGSVAGLAEADGSVTPAPLFPNGSDRTAGWSEGHQPAYLRELDADFRCVC